MDNINRCGTHTGYRYHIDKKQTACMDCKKAYADYQKQWRLNNKDKVLIIQRKSYSKNIQKNRESVSKLRLNNLDKKRSNNTQYKARKRNNNYEFYTEQQVLDAYGFLCHLCGIAIDMTAPRRSGLKNWEMGLHIDHVIPLSKGGADSLVNVRPSHGLCNSKKNNNI